MMTRITFGALGALGAVAAAAMFELLAMGTSLESWVQDSRIPALLIGDRRSETVHGTRVGTGDVRATLTWSNKNDLDLHVVEGTRSASSPARRPGSPLAALVGGEEIYFGHRRSATGGELDVDANAGGGGTNTPVENIFWPPSSAPATHYRVYVHYFAKHCSQDRTHYKVDVIAGRTKQDFEGDISLADEQGLPRLVYEFDYRPNALAMLNESSFWVVLLIVALWGGLLGSLVGLVLRGAVERRLQRPSEEQAPVRRVAIRGALSGLIGGAVGQALYALWLQPTVHTPPADTARAIGMAIVGGVLGLGLGQCVPRLPGWAGALAGALGGLLGGWLLGASGVTEVGRVCDAGAVGFLIGLMICVPAAETAVALAPTPAPARQEETKEPAVAAFVRSVRVLPVGVIAFSVPQAPPRRKWWPWRRNR